jgi:hypothetical protein
MAGIAAGAKLSGCGGDCRAHGPGEYVGRMLYAGYWHLTREKFDRLMDDVRREAEELLDSNNAWPVVALVAKELARQMRDRSLCCFSGAPVFAAMSKLAAPKARPLGYAAAGHLGGAVPF